ncbi:TPA: GIY-YIG nuclease family protein [Escherichia coli]|nr:GIY-YIG nuclease family protein [Escherichia coli]
MVRPNTLKQGCGCPKCGRLKQGPKRLTHEEQVTAISKINHDVEVLGEIINNSTKVLCRCKVCDHKWSVTPNDLKGEHGCPKCAGKMKLSHEEQVTAIAKVNPNVEILGKIINTETKVLCRCKICDHKWSVTPNRLKNGQGCPKCYNLRRGQNSKLTHEDQVAAIAKVNPDVEVLGEITGDKTKVLCRCKVCDHKWSATPNNIKRGYGCPRCAKYGFLRHEYGKLYIMVDDPEVPTQMKIGVSVQENKRRNEILKSAHKAGVRIPDLHIVKTLEGPTKNIHELESTMHKAFSNYKINFPVKFNGSEEFFYYRPEVFDMVEEAYKEIVCCQ